MKVSNIEYNAVEVSDIDLENDDHCRELGYIVAEKCVVYINQKVSESRLVDIQNLWGKPCQTLMARFLIAKKLGGRHWREILLYAGYNKLDGVDIKLGGHVSRVSFEKDKKGRPKGFFTNGELNWHCDQHAFHDSQRVVGLLSLVETEGSQTNFLNTAPSYAALNHEDRSAVDELICVYEWDGGSMCEDLIPEQTLLVRYNMVPFSGMECPLKDTTAAGVEGIRFPSQCFSHFKGLSSKESLEYKDYLWSKINKPKNIYQHKWKDGELIFIDQNITLHARPTNVKDGDKRTLCRNISYMDNLYPEHAPIDHALLDGKKMPLDEFAVLVDQQRKSEFQAEHSKMRV